jgi:hypothetical protein
MLRNAPDLPILDPHLSYDGTPAFRKKNGTCRPLGKRYHRRHKKRRQGYVSRSTVHKWRNGTHMVCGA